MSGVVGENILVTGLGNVTVGAVWNCGDLIGNAGRITILMDVNWLAGGGRLPLIENLHTFLKEAAPCG